MPIMPKRIVSLGAAGRVAVSSGSGLRRTLLAATDPPAAAALISRNSRREKLLFVMASPGVVFSPASASACHLFATYNILFAEMLQHAHELGATAVIGIQYDATEVMQGVTEVLCYSTAIVADRI